MDNRVPFETLKNKTLEKIDKTADEIKFYCKDGDIFHMFHEQECCESVTIEDICGDLNDLLGTPILMAEESTKIGDNEEESETWTFYKLATAKGYVTIRWYGESNGYYSEDVTVAKVPKNPKEYDYYDGYIAWNLN